MHCCPPIQETRSWSLLKLGDRYVCSFPSFLDFVSWIEEQRYIEMLFLYFSNNPDIHGYNGKLPEQYFNVWLSFNPGDKIIILAEMWSQDLVVERMYDLLLIKSSLYCWIQVKINLNLAKQRLIIRLINQCAKGQFKCFASNSRKPIKKGVCITSFLTWSHLS